MEALPGTLQDILKNCFHEKAVDCKTAAGSKPGDNVIGKMLSLSITVESGVTHHLVVKASIPFSNDREKRLSEEDKMFAQLVSALGSYQIETAVYQQLLPKIDSLLQSQSPSLPTPKLYFGYADCETGIKSCLVLEDVRTQGYKMADKMKGLTLEEVTMVLEKLAKFHAASYVYLARMQLGDYKDPLIGHPFENPSLRAPEVGKSLKKLIRQICFDTFKLGMETGSISKALYNKILEKAKDPYEIVLQASKQAKAKTEYFTVVVHGDLWTNNVLFKYDSSGKPVDVKFIDFQQSRYASIYDDLHYFVYTSTTAAFREQNLNTCLDLYYTQFQETLHALRGNMSNDEVMNNFSKNKFHEGFRNNLLSAFCYGALAIPFQLGVPPDEKPKSEASAANEQSRTNVTGLNDYAAVFFQNLTDSVVTGAKNSPGAIRRFAELCTEMNQAGVFTNY